MIEKLREACRRLLEEGNVQVVIGYGNDGHPELVTDADHVDRLGWNEQCRSNLTAYLKRKEVRDLGKAAIVVKGCDEKALVVLQRESQVDRAALHVIGMACDGQGLGKCQRCQVRMPRFADETIGEVQQPEVNGEGRWAKLDALMQKSRAERMAYWAEEFDRCVKCYACRQVCPLCYCERCIADKNRPTCIDTSASLKGNFAWHITRAFHLAGRCIGCNECTRVCPAGIDLSLLNMTLARAAATHFNYVAGIDPNAEPVIGSYSRGDKEDFIR